jgi:hypothetical protein
MPSTLLIAAILSVLGVGTATPSNDRPEAQVAHPDVVFAATPAGPNGLWNNVRFGMPRIPRPRIPGAPTF